MKSTLKKYLFVALGFILVSCAKTEVEPTGAIQEGPKMKVTLTSLQTKTAMVQGEGNAFTPKWTSGDQLGVFVRSNGANVNTNIQTDALSADTESATFTVEVQAPEEDGTYEFYTYYPYNELEGSDYNTVRVAIPSEQYPANGSFDPKADILTGYPKAVEVTAGQTELEGLQLRFLRKSSIVRFLIPSCAGFDGIDGETPVSEVTVFFDKNVTGVATWDITQIDDLVLEESDASNAVTLKFTEAHKITDPLWLSIAPVSGVKKLTFAFKVADNAFLYAEANLPEDGVTFAAGGMKKYDIPINATNWSLKEFTNKYVKVTETPASWLGKYLIVGENNSTLYACNQTEFGSWGRCSVVAAETDGSIISNTTIDGYAFEVVEGTIAGAYAIKTSNGKYLSSGAKGACNVEDSQSDSKTDHTLSVDNGFVTVESSNTSGRYLRYNHNGGSGGLRFYDGTTGVGVSLYKRVEDYSEISPVIANPEGIPDAVASSGVTDATFTVEITNLSKYSVLIPAEGGVDGTVVTAASISYSEGVATVTYSVAANTGADRYGWIKLQAGSVEKKVDIYQATGLVMDGEGTAEKPYSVADALYMISKLENNETSATAVYVKGEIVGESIEFNAQYGNATFQIADSNTSEDELTVYRVKDFGEEKFTANDQLAVGDEVVVLAKLQKYVKESVVTPETKEGSIYSINGHTSILTGITLGEKKTEYYTGEEFVKPAVTASYRGKASATVTDATTFTGYDLTTPGVKTVTASYTEGGIEKEETYDITVYNGTYYTIYSSVNNDAMGSVAIKVAGESATQAREGAEVTVTITPNSDYIFISLTLNGEDKTSQVSVGEFTFDMPASDASIYVTFADKPEETTVSTDQFTAISGNLDNNIAFAAAQGDATNIPIIPSNETFIRIYQNGGTFTVTPNNGATITEVVIGSNQATSVIYSIDGGTSSSSNSITANGTLTVSKSVSDNIVFTCKGTDKNSRLEVNYLKVTYYGGQEKTKLASPTGFECSAQTSSSLTFSWNAVTNASGYKVSTDGGQNYSEVQESRSYKWTGLNVETTYTLYVKAVDESNIYLDSDPVSAQGTTDEAGQGTETKTLIIDRGNLDGVTSYSTSEKTFTEDDIVFGYINMMENGNNGTPSGWAKNQVLQTKSGGYLYNKTSLGKITSIKFYTVVNTNAFKLNYGNTDKCSNSIASGDSSTGTQSITYSAYSNKTVTPGQSGTANTYEFDLSSSDAEYFKFEPGGSTYILKIEINYEN